jgi:hypothetical protein
MSDASIRDFKDAWKKVDVLNRIIDWNWTTNETEVPNRDRGSAFVSGFAIALGIVAIAFEMTNRVESAGISTMISLTTASIFIGTSTGHFLGLAINNRGGRLTWFLIGFFAILSAAFLSKTRISPIGGTLISFVVGILFLHVSGTIDNYTGIERFISTISQEFSAFILGILATLNYIIPFFFEILSKVVIGSL